MINTKPMKTVEEIRADAMRAIIRAELIEDFSNLMTSLDRMENDDFNDALQTQYCVNNWALQSELKAQIYNELIDYLRTL